MKQTVISTASAPRSMRFAVGLGHRRIYGGPYSKKPMNMLGVKLAPEVVGQPVTFLVPIMDYGVPVDLDNVNDVVVKVLRLLADNERPVYVGCLGGQGRTGLFLALLAKAVGVSDPVAYVRENFNPKAIETEAQEEYVDLYASPLTWCNQFGLIWRSLRGGAIPRV